jgi:hypothetical protein
MNLRPVSLLALVCVFAPAFGQSQRQTVDSYPVDTRSFFPQIVESVSQKGFKVQQGIVPPDLKGRPNNLRSGQVVGQSSVSPAANFPGISQSGLTPGDPDLAVGTGAIVEVINSQIAFFTKAGVKTFQQSAQTFFAGMGAFNFQFDPKVSYDRFHDRFVLVFLERDTSAGPVSKILAAVSDDGDPAGTWHRYRIEAKLNLSGNDYWMDYPGLGYNKDAYVVNGNMFPFGAGGFGGVQFLVIPSAQAMGGLPVTVTSLRHASGASAQAADTNDPNQNHVIAVSRASSSTARIYAIQNLTTAPTFTSVTVAVPSHGGPAGDAESTNGRFLDTIDARVFNAVVRDGRLLTGHNFEGTTFVGCKWYEFDLGTWPTAGVPTLAQAGEIQSSLFNYFFPAINKNASGRVSVLFTRSSTTTTADFMVASRMPGQAPGTIGAPVLMMSSVGNNYAQNRWGDYFCMDVDPVDDVTFWGVHMLVAANNSWWTEILSWRVPGITVRTASNFSWFRGTAQSGNLASLTSDDDDFLVAKAGLVLFPSEAPAQLETEVQAASNFVDAVDVTIKSKVNTPGLMLRAEIWNRTTGLWDSLGDVAAGVIEASNAFGIPGPMADYLDPISHRVKVKFSWFRTGLTLVWPWTVSVDQVQFVVSEA